MGAAQKIDIHGAKGGEEKPKTPTETPDSLRSVAIAKMLIAVGEGEFEGTPTAQDIYLDNTPLQDPQGNMNFPNVKWEWRTGAVDQTYIQGIPSVENETTISTELRSGAPWVRAINNVQLSAVRVRFAWPALQSVDAGGNINGYRIEYKVELATDGGAYQQVLSEAVDGKTTSVYERTRRIDLPKATSGWLMRITRLTINQNNNKISDTMQIAGFTEVIDAKLRYPNTALLYIEFSAEQFRSIPAVTVETKLKKMQVPSNYDPVSRSYTGIWDGTFKQAWTDNAAWMTYDITTADRFGLGRRIKPWMVDKWELYRISQYCDQLVPDGKGGQEPRFICNLNLQSKADAWSLLRDISAIYRGMTYWAQGQVFTLSDMPRATDFDFAYTRANVLDGKFTYSSASERTRYTRALISYDNPLNNYDTDVTAVSDQKLQRRYGDNPLEISAIGCTRESEAQRRGKWALLTNSKDRAVNFKVGMDGRIPLPGYVIPIADELLAGRPVGGRISSVNGKVITLDRDTQAKAGDRLILNLPDGKCEGRTVQVVNGRQVTVTVAYTVTPEPELVWALDADDLAIPLYRVVSVARPEPGVFEISAVQYDPSKFAHIDTGARLEERPISVIPITVVAPPASVTLSSSYMVDQGITVATMNISWPAVNGAVAYDVEWRKDSGNWIKVQRTGSTSVDVTGIYSGAYMARVRSVSAFEISSIWKSSNLTNLEGKVGVPPAVSFLTTTSELFGISIKWGFPPGAEDTQRTEVWYGAANSLPAATKLADLAYPQADYRMQQLKAGATLFFWARLVDRSGNIGPWFPDGAGVFGQSSTDADAILDMLVGEITESQLGQELLSEITQISGDGQGSVNERLELIRGEIDTIKDDLQGQIGDTNIALDRAKEDLLEQLSDTNATLTDVRAELQDQIDAIADLADSMPYKPDLTYTARQGALGANGIIYQALQNVPVNTPPPNATYWLDVGQAVVAANGLATRVQTVETKVTSIEGVNTAQATQITGLNSSLVTTNGNVTAAQNAANAANTLAGGKGKVIVQSAAPAVADQLAQNLWIDTTGNANTPKRWTGSAWAAVTDKAATDAAAAAASALALAQTKADASAVNSLTTRVTNAEGTISSQGSAITSLTNTVNGKADSSALTALTSRVTSAEGVNTSQGTAITGLTNSLTTTNGNVTTAQNAANAANTLAGGKGKVLVQSAAPAVADQLAQNLWIDTTNNANTPKRWTGSVWAAVTDKAATDAAAAAANALALAQTKADASAVNSLTTRVTASEGTITSQGSAITGLTNSLTTTNGNVTTAQNAANAANTLAGGKGKVLVQSAAPAVADQLVQNLWIDTTNNANTPKRWTGSSWVAVTDKAATDAATAAANALALAQTKADASVVSSLTTRVTSVEGSISSQGSAITGLNNSLTTTNTNVTTAQTAATNAATLAGSKGKVMVQSVAPAAADQLAQNLWIDITGGANMPKRWTGSAWAAVTDKIATDAAAAAASALTQVATKADASTVQALSNTVTQQGNTITAQGTSLTDIQATVGTLGASGVNLLPAEYAVYGKTLPVISGSSFTVLSEADVGSLKGYALKVDWVSASSALSMHFAKTTTDDSANMGFKRQKYIISFYAKASVAGHQVAAYLRTYSAGGGATTITGPTTVLLALTTEWQRYSSVVDYSDARFVGDKMMLSFQMSRSGVANRSVWLDRIMVEPVVGNATEPSVFSLGDGYDQVLANAAATTALSARVTQTETGLTSTSNQITSLANSIGGSGTNLILAEYASFTEKPPATHKAAALVMTTEADAAAYTGYLLRASNTAAGLGYLYLAASTTDYNLRLEPNGKYIVSFWAKASAAHVVNVRLRFVNTSGGSTEYEAGLVNVTTTLTRHSLVITAPSTLVGRSVMVLYTQNGSVIGDTWFDGFMLEEQVGSSTAPSAFTPGSAGRQAAATSSAVDSLTSAVTQQGSTLTSLSSQVTSLNGSVTAVTSGLETKASTTALNALAGRVTNAEGALTSTSSSLTELKSTVDGIGGSGANLLPSEYTTFGAIAPAMSKAGATNVTTEALASATGGYLLKVDNTTAITGYLYLAASGTDYNMRLKPGAKYIVSFWARGSAAHSLGLRIRYNNAAGALVETEVGTQAITTTLARYSVVLTMPADMGERCCFLIFTQRTAAIGVTYFDGFMFEAQLGNAATASEFVPGVDSRQISAQALALSSTQATVTQQGTSITAQTSQIDTLSASVGNANSAIQTEATARAGADSAQATQITNLQSSLTSTNAAIQSEVTTRANADSAMAKRIDGVQSTAGTASANAQTALNTAADVSGKASAMWSVKLQVDSAGRYYAAGIGLGLENTGAGLQSSFIVSADRFAIINGLGGSPVSPFAVVGGQTFISSAFIQDASITSAKIGDYISSSNFVPNTTGWVLYKNGVFEINSAIPGGGKVQLTSNGLFVYDNNGVLRVQVGNLG